MMNFKGTREAFANALLDTANQDSRIMFVSPDSLKAMRASSFADHYPDQYVEAGIAEQNAVNIAAGMAACGLIPFVGTYAGFLTMRACEQMRTFVAYPNLNVKFIGINAGLLGGEREGVTHQFYEDIGILSNIPNFTIYTPADAAQTYHAVKLAARTDGPVYIRAGSGREPDVYSIESEFSPDGITLWREYGQDVLLLSSGFLLNRVLAAADLLYKDGIHVSAADINILYGQNPEKILDSIKKAHQIVTVEDHNINGGLGAYISKLVCETTPKQVTRIGLTTFGESGPAKELADYYRFSPAAIVDKVKEIIK